MEPNQDNYQNTSGRQSGEDASGTAAESPLEGQKKENTVLGSVRLARLLGTSVREGSWLNWGLVILIGAALFAIYKFMAVVLYFVR